MDTKDLENRLRRLEEESSRYRHLFLEAQQEIQHLRRYIDLAGQTMLSYHGTEEGVKEEVQRLRKIIDGDPGLDLRGLRKETQELRETVARLIIEKEAVVNQIKGARWLAGAAGLTTIANVLGIANGWFGG